MAPLEQRAEILIPGGHHIKPAIMRLIDDQGFLCRARSNGDFHLDALNSPVSYTVLNQADVIPQVIAGKYDGGFIGEDIYWEYMVSLGQENLPSIQKVAKRFMVFQPKLRLSILVRDNPEDNARYQKVTDLAGRTLLTTYPALMREFLTPRFQAANLDLPIIDGNISGKEERLLADGKCEAVGVIVDTGTAMREATARELVVVRNRIQVALIYSPEHLQAKGRERSFKTVVNHLRHGVPQKRDLLPYFAEPSQAVA